MKAASRHQALLLHQQEDPGHRCQPQIPYQVAVSAQGFTCVVIYSSLY